MKTFRKRLASVVLLVVTAAAVGLFYVGGRKSPDAVAVLQINHPQYTLPPTFPETFDFDEFVETQRQLLSSRAIMSHAVNQVARTLPALIKDNADPVSFLADRVTTSMISRSLLEVRMTGDEFTAAERVKLLEAVIDAYLTSQKDIQGKERLRLVKLLTEERDRLQNELIQELENLKDVEQRTIFPETDPSRTVIDDADGSRTEIRTRKLPSLELSKKEVELRSSLYDGIVSRILELEVNSGAPTCVSVLDAPAIRKR